MFNDMEKIMDQVAFTKDVSAHLKRNREPSTSILILTYTRI